MHSRSRGASVGERIARERDRQGLALSALSRRATELVDGARGTSRTALRNLEEGRVEAPNKVVVEAVARILGVEEAWLWTGERPRFARDGRPGAADSISSAPVLRPLTRTRARTAVPPASGPVEDDSAPRRDWLDSPPSLLRGASRRPPRQDWLERAPRGQLPVAAVGEASDVDVPAVPEAHPVWGPGVARTIASRSRLARGPVPVRTRFWTLLRAAADDPHSGVKGPDDILRLARQLDDLVMKPLELVRPGAAEDRARFERYALSILDSVESVADDAGPGRPTSPTVRPAPPSPLDRENRDVHDPLPRPGRRQREGLTWKLM